VRISPSSLSAPNESIDSDNDNMIVIDKDKADIADSHNKGDSVLEEKVCCSEIKKEQDNMEIVVDLSTSSSVVKKEVSSCSRNVHNSCTSDGGKHEVHLQMDSDSRKKPKIVVEKVIDTTSTSISLTQESFLMQIFSTSVKPISLGSVVHGKLWCNKQAIYPKGML